MINRHALNQYIHQLLDCDSFQDYAPNGLQVEGNEYINSICTAVTASQNTIIQAVNKKADALLVHHGYFWKGEQPSLTGIKKNRVATLLKNNLNLFAYHLPLDCHLSLGNNACLAKLFQIQSVKQHDVGGVKGLLWSGTLDQEENSEKLKLKISKALQRDPLHISPNDEAIKTIAWCSGAAQDYIEQAHALGAQAYISGEISERTYYQAQELGIHYFAAGHHATERYGIQALGQHLAEKFDIKHQYLDEDNPI